MHESKGIHAGVEWLGFRIHECLIIQDNVQLLSKVYQFTTPQTVHRVPYFPQPCQHVFAVFLMIDTVIRVKRYLTAVLLFRVCFSFYI